MTIYFIVAFIVLFFSLLAEQKNYPAEVLQQSGRNSQVSRICLFIACITLIFVAGFRYYVGVDYGQYAYAYSGYVRNFRDDLLSFNEPGIRLAAYISSFIYNAPVTMFVLMAVLTVGLCTKTIIKNTPYFCFAMAMYIFMGNWHGSFNAVRQSAAAAIVFAGHRYIIERKFIKYLLVVLLASCFHITAVVMLIPYFLGNIKFNLKNTLLLLGGAVVTMLSYDFVFNFVSFLKDTTVSIDSSSYMSRSVNIFRILVAITPVIALFFFAEQDSDDSEYNFYVNMIIIHAAAMVAASGSAYLARIGIFTGLFFCLSFPRVFMRERTKNTVILTRSMICMYFAYWIYEISISNSLNNFQWVFGK